MEFVSGVATSVIATVLVWLTCSVVWPYIHDRWLYTGVRIDGVWEIHSFKGDDEVNVGRVTFRQQGSRIIGEGYRSQTRQGDVSDRRFRYHGRISGDRVTLLFHDTRGVDFDSGTYVFCLHNDYVVMDGMASFHGKPEGRVVAERRILRKTAAPLPRD